MNFAFAKVLNSLIVIDEKKCILQHQCTHSLYEQIWSKTQIKKNTCTFYIKAVIAFCKSCPAHIGKGMCVTDWTEMNDDKTDKPNKSFFLQMFNEV